MIKKMFLGLLLVTSHYVFSSEIEVKISGMVCSMCAQGIEKNFSKVSEVEKVKVDLDAKSVLLTIKQDKNLDDKRIKDVITTAGYDVREIKRK